MKTKATAKAELKPIFGARIFGMMRGDTSYPAAIYKGDLPDKGDTLLLTLDNGVTYSGVIYDATAHGGEVMAEFENGLTPLDTTTLKC